MHPSVPALLALGLLGSLAFEGNARADSMIADGIHFHTAHCGDLNAYQEATTPITFQDAKTNQATWVAWLMLSGDQNPGPEDVSAVKQALLQQCRSSPAAPIDTLMREIVQAGSRTG